MAKRKDETRNTWQPTGWGMLSFGWCDKVVGMARRKEAIGTKDLYLPNEQMANRCYDEFQKEWGKQLKSGKNRPLLRTLFALYGRRFFTGGMFKLLWSMFVICGAFYFVRSLLLYVDEDETGNPYDPDWTGWCLSAGFFGASVLWSLCLQRMGYIAIAQGVKVRASLLTAVTRRSVFMAEVTSEQTADIVNFVASDIRKVYDGMQEFHFLWAAPWEALTILILVSTDVGVWMLPAFGLVSFIIFVQYFFGWRIAVNKYKCAEYAAARGGITQEILPSMKLVKYYGWEGFFERKIMDIRKNEQALAAWNNVLKTINICLVFSVPPTCAFAIFASYEFNVERVSSTLAFTTLTLFNIMRFPLVVLPKALRAASEASAAIARIEKYLLEAKLLDQKGHDKTSRGIDIKNAVFQYDGHDGHAFKLTVPEFNVKPGEVVAVVGRVGAGKTALLQAIMSRMPQRSGHCHVGGQMAYVPQTAWIQNLSIRDNILFGNKFHEAKYRDVVHACALEPDFQMLPQGDSSMGGLRGLNLSGGQRQRVNVARAAYFGADTILLDNALSAVDHHTAEHIFTNCIKGTFSKCSTILITHQLTFVRRCDKVAILDGGEFKYFGPFTAEAQSILAQYLPVPEEDTAESMVKKSKSTSAPKTVSTKKEAKPDTTLPMLTANWRFLCAGPAWKVLLGCSFGLVSQASRQMSDFWIRAWSNDGYNRYENDEEHGSDVLGSQIYVYIYGALTFAFFAIQVIRTGLMFYGWTCASNRVFKKMLHRVLNTPMGFFLVKPVGELLNTFSSDINKADEALPDAAHLAYVYAIILLSTAVTVSSQLVEFVGFAAVLLLVTYIMLRLYLPTATKVKALVSDTAGMLIGLTAETLEGLEVIQAYEHEEFFVKEFTRGTDEHHRSLFNSDTLNLWISFYCDFYGAVMLVAVGMFAVSQRDRGAANVGLAFSNTIQLLVFYTWTLRLVTEAISLSSSIEQITWLAQHTPIDGQDDINNAGKQLKTGIKWKELKAIRVDPDDPEPHDPISCWPTDGTIIFENVKMRYRPTAHLALAGVNLRIGHGEKVGIVGRTGSGKSTLLLALYHMFDLAEGRITVSGVDITTLPLQRQRRGLSIIPQEPVMFTGTLRENLDPFNDHDDRELLQLIDEVGLGTQARACGGLEGYVAGSGSDRWSVGQMQLVCLIRAALNKVPIVCMDEATAALDPHTEEHVLEVADKLFSTRTVLTIAHRLDAVIASDTVVVMEQGKVAETGAPKTLLDDKYSWFSKLVDMSGPAEAAHLRQVAAKHFASTAGRVPTPIFEDR